MSLPLYLSWPGLLCRTHGSCTCREFAEILKLGTEMAELAITQSLQTSCLQPLNGNRYTTVQNSHRFWYHFIPILVIAGSDATIDVRLLFIFIFGQDPHRLIKPAEGSVFMRRFKLFLGQCVVVAKQTGADLKTGLLKLVLS